MASHHVAFYCCLFHWNGCQVLNSLWITLVCSIKFCIALYSNILHCIALCTLCIVQHCCIGSIGLQLHSALPAYCGNCWSCISVFEWCWITRRGQLLTFLQPIWDPEGLQKPKSEWTMSCKSLCGLTGCTLWPLNVSHWPVPKTTLIFKMWSLPKGFRFFCWLWIKHWVSVTCPLTWSLRLWSWWKIGLSRPLYSHSS